MSTETDDKKPIIDPPTKSSMEILSELFSSFDAEPPVIVKKEKKDPSLKKSKKSKKKHKHKDKKHKKKEKKKKRNDSKSSDLDLAQLLIKQEKEASDGKIMIEGTDLSLKININNIKHEIKEEKNEENDNKSITNENNNKIDIKFNFKTITESSNDKNNKKSSNNKKNVEDGELSESSDHSRSTKNSSDNNERKKSHKRKHSKDRHESKSKRKRHKSPSKESSSNDQLRTDDLRNKLKKSASSKNKSKDDKHKDHDFHRRTSKDDYKSKDRDRESSSKSRDKYSRRGDDYYERSRRSKDRDDYFYKSRDYDSDERDYKSSREKYSRRSSRDRDDDFYKMKDYDSDREERWINRERYRGSYTKERDNKRYRDRSNSREKTSSTHIDKKKLLEIARKNAIQMMKSGNLPGALTLGPQAQEKVIAAIRAGGKTIDELIDFCKTLSKKEELGDLSSGSDGNGSDSDNDKPFHHPFQIKDRPTSITMNIKNSVPLPIKSTQERSSELRMQFPVSSGQLHRKTENEWVPVSPKKVETTSTIKTTSQITPTPILAIEAPPVPLQVQPSTIIESSVVETSTLTVNNNSLDIQQNTTETVNNNNNNNSNNAIIDIGSIVSQRLTAMRKLQENPNDVQALTQIYKSNKEMQSWAQSKQQPGQFTGSTGAQILSQAELSSGFQAWAKKDQLQSATPVSGGMGMHLLQKMGWKPGEGLGKEKHGTLEPLLLEVKLDKKGLVANEEQKRKKQKPPQPNQVNTTTKTLQSKHPVSLLGEYASKKKLGAPEYTLCFECGPDHKKNFLFKVVLNGIEYKPNVASPNKKEAKAAAALICLQHIGLLPP